MTLLFPPLWSLQLQPASFRGVVFQVLESEIVRGRRIAIHEYPGRDVVVCEDLGAGRQELAFTGFLVGDDCYLQRDRLAIVCDRAGSGNLVHPSVGSVQANLVSVSFSERAEDGRMVGVSMRFVVANTITFATNFPRATNSLHPTPQGPLDTIAAAITDFTTKVQNFISSAVSAVQTFIAPVIGVIQALAPLAGIVMSAVGIASAGISAVKGMSLGSSSVSLGRYAQGSLPPARNGPTAVPQATAVTIQTATAAALSTAATARASVITSLANVSSLAATSDAAFPQAMADLMETTRTAINDPVDQIAALVTIASYSLPLGVSNAPIGQAIITEAQATAALARRCALASIANACSAYQSTSSTETRALIAQIGPLYDAEITYAADTGDLSSYRHLRTLKTDTISALQISGAQLPELITISRKRSLPSLALSQQLYQTAERSDDLLKRSAAPNGCFLPLQFTALSA